MRVFLIHGMGRSKASLMMLARRLGRMGYEPSVFGYKVRKKSLEAIADDFAAHIREVLHEDATENAETGGDAGAFGSEPPRYGVIGHSLGNIITRLAAERLPPDFARFIMLAPPNRSPKLAQALKENGLFQVLTGDAGQRLADPTFYEALPVPEVPSCILAGETGPALSWLPFDGDKGDGIVAVEETRLDNIEHRVVPALHTFIMNDRDVLMNISHFLKEGVLPDAEAKPLPGLDKALDERQTLDDDEDSIESVVARPLGPIQQRDAA